MSGASNNRTCEHGAALVEFAIVLPVFLMMVLGAIDWGYFFVVREALGNAAREGARGAIVGASDAISKQQSYLSGLFPAGTCDVSSESTTSGTPPVTAISVTAHCDTIGSLSGVTEIPPFTWVQPPLLVSSTVTMRQ